MEARDEPSALLGSVGPGWHPLQALGGATGGLEILGCSDPIRSNDLMAQEFWCRALCLFPYI